MAKPFTRWTVLQHDALAAVDRDILTVTGVISMPLTAVKRRMTVVRLQDGRLVVFSAIALDEAGMRTIEEFGKLAFLIVPNAAHRMDAKIWKDRYPGMQVIGPAGGRAEIAKIVLVDATHADFGDQTVTLVSIPGTADREFALEVRRPAGATLVLNDIVGNIRDAAGFSGWLLRLMRYAGSEPQISRPAKMMLIKDKAAVAQQMRRWAEIPSLKRILVAHGAPIENDPSGALRKLAASLG